ncbi:MAG: LPS-assembly protein LptD [Steroidobacteraceae bacterium]
MLRWRPFLFKMLSLGSLASVAWASDPPVCPSETSQPERLATPASASAAREPASNGKAATAGGKLDVKERKPGIGDGAIDITSDRATLGTDGNATLQGNVTVHQADREIHAQHAQYNTKTNGIKTEGAIEYEDPVVHVTGEGGNYTPAEGADFQSAQFDLRQRAARGSADTMRLTPQGVLDLKGVRFTTCPKAKEAWRIRADRVTLDTRSRIGSARDARVDFEGVPILYLPWLSFPLGNERKSGFLFPTVGNSSRSGAELAVPYYWNIAPNADFTFQPILYSRRGADLGGDLRYMNPSDHGELTWNYLPYDDVFGASRSRVKLTNVMELPGDFRFSIDAENVSDTTYFEDFAQGPEGTSTAFVQRQATLTYRDEHWKIDGEVQHYQTTDNTLAQTDRPYARLPSLAVSGNNSWGPAELLRYGFESEVVNFARSVNFDRAAACGLAFGVDPCVTGWRVDVMPDASIDLAGPGYFVRPGIAWRATQYALRNTDPGEDRSPLRTLPIASFDTGLLFERNAGSHDQRRVTLEPRLLYLYVPYRNQDQLPLFDTALPDLDPVELFRNNRYVGADRVGDANQVSVGVTSRLLDARDGRQFLAATFGQTYYFTTPRVLLPGEEVRTDHRSDFVAQLALTAFQDWSADLGLQWDPQTSRSERSQVNIQYKPAGESVINVGYRYQRDVLEQAEISTAWPISQSWNVFLRGVYSLKDHTALERFAGFEYRACCWRVRFGGRRFVSTHPVPPATTGAQDTGIWVQLELTGLASVGSASDSFLTEAIRGYAPADRTMQKLPAP